MAQDAGGSRPRALAHLVRERRRSPREAAARRPACRHGAQPGAAAALEGRAARRRLPRLELDREDRLRGRRHGHRGERGHAARHPRAPTRRSTRQGRTSSTTASTSSAWKPLRRRRPGARASASTPTGPPSIFVGRITRQKGLPYLLRAARAAAAGGAARPLRRSARTRRRSWPRSPAWSEQLQAERDGVVWIDRLLPRTTSCASLLTAADRVRLPVGLRAARHREPRGDGLRAAGRRHRDRRHPRGHRRRRDRPAGADRAGAGRHRHADRPGALRGRPGGRPHRGRAATRATAATDGARGPGAGRDGRSAGRHRASRRGRSTARSLSR